MLCVIGVTQMDNYQEVYLRNAIILVKETFCYRYSAINNSAKNNTFSGLFSNLLGIKCKKFCLDSFRFDITIVRRLRGYFFRTQCRKPYFSLLVTFRHLVNKSKNGQRFRTLDCVCDDFFKKDFSFYVIFFNGCLQLFCTR